MKPQLPLARQRIITKLRHGGGDNTREAAIVVGCGEVRTASIATDAVRKLTGILLIFTQSVASR
jgi:hypothetical protein